MADVLPPTEAAEFAALVEARRGCEVIVVLDFMSSAAEGVTFGDFPARGTARPDSIEALRHE
jgi:hypothetical protein